MDQSFHTALARQAGHTRRSLDMHRIEGCAAAFDVKADGIDDPTRAEERCGDRGLVTDVSFRSLGPCIRSGRRSSPFPLVPAHRLDHLIAVRDCGRRDRGNRLRVREEASALAGDPEQISIGTFDQDIAAEAETTGLPHSANSSHAQAQASVFEPGHP